MRLCFGMVYEIKISLSFYGWGKNWNLIKSTFIQFFPRNPYSVIFTVCTIFEMRWILTLVVVTTTKASTDRTSFRGIGDWNFELLAIKFHSLISWNWLLNSLWFDMNVNVWSCNCYRLNGSCRHQKKIENLHWYALSFVVTVCFVHSFMLSRYFFHQKPTDYFFIIDINAGIWHSKWRSNFILLLERLSNRTKAVQSRNKKKWHESKRMSEKAKIRWKHISTTGVRHGRI